MMVIMGHKYMRGRRQKERMLRGEEDERMMHLY
jgi:hypothetical protein